MSRPLRVGVQLPEVERTVRWPEYLSMARAAEEAGFDSVWVGDHLLYRDDARPERGPWEAWTLLAALASVTERVHLGPLVACLAFHPPAVLAKMAATVDEVSGGRFVLGVGAGWNAAEFRAFGLPFDRRASRFADAFAILHPLVRGGRVTHTGEFWSADDAVLLPEPHRPVPLMVGSTGERVLRLALPHADAWNAWYDSYGNTAEGFAALAARVAKIGRDVGAGAVATSACVLVALEHGAGERTHAAPPVRGTPTHVARHLTALASAGAQEAILVLDPITETSIRALGDALALLDA